MPLLVPLQSVPSQSLIVQLNGQDTQINLRTRRTGLFMDVLVSNAPIIQGVICYCANWIVRSAYLGFQGDFMFIDRVGNSDPIYYTGLGDRFQLVYLFPSDFS